MKVLFNIAYTPAQPRKDASEFQILDWKNERAFYDLSAEYNYVTYSLNGVKTAKHKDILDYMEKDTGAFNLERPLTKADIKDLKDKLKKSKSIIWHGFISFDKETSVAFTTPEQARVYLKQTLGALFENSHLDKNNIDLMASLHVDRAHHHHIHFEFWEKEPKRLNKNGEKCFTQKGRISQKCIDNYLISASLALEDNKNDLHLARDRALSRLKEIIAVHKHRRSEIGNRLAEIASILPATGKLSYKSENMAPLRNRIDKAVDFIAARDDKFKQFVCDMYSEIIKREKKAQEIAKSNKILWTQGGRIKPQNMIDKLSDEQYKKYGIQSNKFACVENLRLDFRARLGQIVISAAKRIKVLKTANALNCKHAGRNAMRIAARKDAAMLKRNVNQFLIGLENSTLNIRTQFSPLLHQAEYEIAQEQKRYGIK